MVDNTAHNIQVSIRSRAERNVEIRKAVTAYPDIEVGAAYKLWKEARGETSTVLSTAASATVDATVADQVDILRHRPCTKPGCTGSQYLEPICGGCVEGQAGYKTKWTCRICLHRDLSREDFNAWLIKLSSG